MGRGRCEPGGLALSGRTVKPYDNVNRRDPWEGGREGKEGRSRAYPNSLAPWGRGVHSLESRTRKEGEKEEEKGMEET